MNPKVKSILKSVFSKKKKKLKIRLLTPQFANLDVPSQQYRGIGEIVTVSKLSILIFQYKKGDRLYFKVHDCFHSPLGVTKNISMAEDGDILYFSEYRFNNSLKYKKL
jgi:hypothetical protein